MGRVSEGRGGKLPGPCTKSHHSLVWPDRGQLQSLFGAAAETVGSAIEIVGSQGFPPPHREVGASRWPAAGMQEMQRSGLWCL